MLLGKIRQNLAGISDDQFGFIFQPWLFKLDAGRLKKIWAFHLHTVPLDIRVADPKKSCSLSVLELRYVDTELPCFFFQFLNFFLLFDHVLKRPTIQLSRVRAVRIDVLSSFRKLDPSLYHL